MRTKNKNLGSYCVNDGSATLCNDQIRLLQEKLRLNDNAIDQALHLSRNVTYTELKPKTNIMSKLIYDSFDSSNDDKKEVTMKRKSMKSNERVA